MKETEWIEKYLEKYEGDVHAVKEGCVQNVRLLIRPQTNCRQHNPINVVIAFASKDHLVSRVKQIWGRGDIADDVSRDFIRT